MYPIIRLFTPLRKFVLEILPLWLKNRNQRACVRARGGGLIRGVTQVLRKGGLICGGRGLWAEKYGTFKE